MCNLCCVTQDLLLQRSESLVVANRLSRCSLQAQLLRSMWDLRNQTHIPYIARQIVNHWTTREVPVCILRADIYENALQECFEICTHQKLK